MGRNERYITTIELNSQEAQNHLQKLVKKVEELKKKKDEALAQGKFFDEKELKKATKEMNQFKAQLTGVQGILDNINDVSLEQLNKALRKLKNQKLKFAPDTDEFQEAERGIMAIQKRIDELKNGAREAREESDRLTANLQNLEKVMSNLKSASLNELTQAQRYLEEQISSGNPESTSYKTSVEQLKEVKARIQEVKAEQQQIIHQIDRYDQEIKQSSKDMATVERETKLVNMTLKHLDTANVRDLEYSIKVLNEQLRETPRGTAAFGQLQEKAKLLRTELERVRFEGSAQQSWLNRTADFFNKIQGAAIAGIGAITGLTFTIRRCVEAFADMDQEMENVRKYTGQTSEQVHSMNEEFKKMDTRTARERLNQLAGDAGRLGITSQEAVMDFVDAADKINVALGDDLGDDAVKNIGKLAMSFGTDKTMGLRGAMLATGSAINELSQNSSASAGYLVDFTARVAGFGKQVGLTQAQLMGYGAVMDENMLRDEMASTAFGQLLVKMTTDLDTFADITGMKVEEYRKLVTENINGAVLAVAKALKGRDMEEMGKIFDSMQLNGQRAIGVLATLGQKVDDVAERQRIANEAFDAGTSIIDEFNIQNNTAAAGIEKNKKRFHDLSVVLGEKLMPIARYGITTTSSMIKLLLSLIEFVGKWKSTLVSLTVVLAALIIKKELDVALTKLQVFWNTKLATVIEKLYAAMIKNPYAAVAAVVTVLVGVIIDLVRRTNEVENATKRLNKIRGEAAEKYGEEKASLDLLLETARNEKASLDKRKEAIDELNKIIPGYNAQLDATTGKYQENKKALDDYLVSLAKKYELEGAGDMLKKIGSDIAKANVEIKTLQEQLKEAEEDENDLAMQTGGVYGRTRADVIRENLKKQNDIIKEAAESRRAIYKAYPELLGQEDGSMNIYVPHDQHYEEEHKNDGNNNKFTDPAAEAKKLKAQEAAAKKAEELRKKQLRERNNAIKAEIEKEMAIVTASYARGEIDYRTYVKNVDAIQIDGFTRRMALYTEESDEYKKLLNDREQYALKAAEKQERLNLKAVQREHNRVVAELENKQWNDEGAYNEARYQAELQYMMKMRDLYRKGSEERVEIEEEIEDMEYIHKLENQKRYQEMLRNIQTEFLHMSNQQQLEIALNGLDELHRQGLLKEEEYQQAKIFIQARYAKSETPNDKAQALGASMLANASAAATKQVGDSGQTPFVGTIKQYRATMDQLKVMYGDDEANHEAYLAAKQQATTAFLSKMGADFKMAYDSVNQIMTAASSLYSAQAELETNQVKKKYEKQIAAAGNNQKKVKKLQEKQAKEEAAIKSKYNAKQVKIQIAQAIAQTAMSAINAYSSAAAVPVVGYILAPIAAAAAVAAGMMQVAAIKKQAQAQEAGYYEGGYTGGHRYRREAGVVHEGEFVANHQTVNNPDVRPVLDLLDLAQRNHTVGTLTADDISRQLGGGGSTVVTPVVNVTNDNEELRDELARSRDVNQRLLTIIEEKGINIDFPMDKFDNSYKHFTKLNNR